MAIKLDPILQKAIVGKSPEELRTLGKVWEDNGLTEWTQQLNQYLSETTSPTEKNLADFVTADPDMLALKEKVRTLAKFDDPVLITGETGTGKELLARALHGMRRGPFIAINCAGLPEHLIESELFGHVKGAFTDAKEGKPGLFKMANDGTLFLDEIGELPPMLQAKLLRAVQFKRIRKVGGVEEETITCRFVCATHHDLQEMVKSKLFRQDLYYRLATFELKTKALRSRMDDVPLIIKPMLPFDKQTDVDVKAVMSRLSHLLYGNVRELYSAVRSYVIFG